MKMIQFLKKLLTPLQSKLIERWAKWHAIPVVNWSKYSLHLNPDSYRLLWPALSSSTAIAVIASDRPDYFKQVVQCLRATPEAEQMPVFFFLDRSQEVLTDRQEREIIEARFPYFKVIRRPINFGCGRNLIDVRRQLFDHLGYERAFILEDDLVFSPQYLTLCTQLLDWAEANYSNVGVVQAWTDCKLSDSEKLLKLDQVEGTFVNLWGYLITRQCWKTIRSTLYTYEAAFLRDEYHKRPHALIKKWAKSRLPLNRDRMKGRSPFPIDEKWRANRDHFFSHLPAGQDGITALALRRKGWIQLTTTVNRARYIGERGIHMNPRRFREEKAYHLVSLREFSSDQNRPIFKPRPEL